MAEQQKAESKKRSKPVQYNQQKGIPAVLDKRTDDSWAKKSEAQGQK